MFTGLVEALGSVTAIEKSDGSCELVVIEPAIARDLPVGSSVAVNGVCLTAIAIESGGMRFQAGPETLRLTNLGDLRVGDHVNLERSLCVGDRLGGHIVQGHVDGLGSIESRVAEAEFATLWFRCPAALAQQMVPKGSIAVDGISLTLVDVEPERFSVALIPHTLAMTTLGLKGPGDRVNLETDLFAKYVWKYLDQVRT